jgi:dUTP pyrophosphatase
LPLPSYATAGAAGADLCAAVASELVLDPGERTAVPTGLMLEIPEGYEGQVRPRSGLAIKTGLTIVNAPGTIDSDYRGELKVLLINLGSESVSIVRGDRIAQLLIAPVTRSAFIETDGVSASERGEGGFGSTGV